MRPRLLFLGTHRAYLQYLREHGLHPAQMAWLAHPETVRGLDVGNAELVRSDEGLPPNGTAVLHALRERGMAV